jgi:hypothetical protein
VLDASKRELANMTHRIRRLSAAVVVLCLLLTPSSAFCATPRWWVDFHQWDGCGVWGALIARLLELFSGP